MAGSNKEVITEKLVVPNQNITHTDTNKSPDQIQVSSNSGRENVYNTKFQQMSD